MGKKEIIIDVANKLGTNPEWLNALIQFESGGTYNPKVKNKTSSARGLIQVIDSTAKSDFGMPDSLALVNRYPTFKSQMYNVVYPYLKKYAPLTTKQALYMAVFYPKYRYVAPSTRFPQKVIDANARIYTPKDYIQFVDRRYTGKWPKDGPLITPALIYATAALIIVWRMKAR